MVKLVDAHASGACGDNSVEVRVFFRAPSKQFFLKDSFSVKNVIASKTMFIRSEHNSETSA